MACFVLERAVSTFLNSTKSKSEQRVGNHDGFKQNQHNGANHETAILSVTRKYAGQTELHDNAA